MNETLLLIAIGLLAATVLYQQVRYRELKANADFYRERMLQLDEQSVKLVSDNFIMMHLLEKVIVRKPEVFHEPNSN